MKYVMTTAVEKLLKLRKRIRFIAGGTAGSKTIGVLQIFIDKAQSDKTPKLASVTSESMPHLKRGAMRDFLSIMKEHNYYDDKRWNKSDFTYTFETGSKIEFFSLDMPHKVRGPRRERLFVNEVNNIPKETFEQLEIRTTEEIWADYNPTYEFWAYENYINNPAQQDSTDFLTLTYKDNEGLPENIKGAIERRKGDKAWWTVYGLGQLGEVESRIYKGWQIIDEIPHEARLERYGLDFGYTNDPTAIIALYYYNGGYIVDEILCRTGMLNREIADTLKNLPKALIVADSAEPKSIAEIKGYGLNIIGAKKQKEQLGGIESYVKWSIGQVQQQKVSMTKQSVNVIRAYRNYLWKTDKEGTILNIPDHYLSDCMDAIRYAITSLAPILQRADYINSLPFLIQTNEEPENPAR